MVSQEIVSDDELSQGESSMNSSSSSIADKISIGNEIEKRKGYFNGDSLSVGFTRVYGHHWNGIPLTIHELSRLDNFKDVLNLIESQKVYHINGIMREFDVSRYAIDTVQGILTRRKLLTPIIWTGKSKGMFGMKLLCTQDCTEELITSYLIDYEATDELKYQKELQRSNKKTPEEVVDHNIKVKELSDQAKKDEAIKLDESIDWCDWSGVDFHGHKKNCPRSHRT